MNNIQMVDLKNQYKKIKAKVDQSIIEVFESTAFINGPEVKKFQRELELYLNVKHVIPCANGTDALKVALMSLGLKEGDEVITSDFTFAATVEVISLLKLTPVLVDVNEDTFTIDTNSIKNAITTKTKAIIPVHLFGQCANMEEIKNIAKTHNLYVIEDNAQAIGATYTFKNGNKAKAGTIGHIGTTSFFPSKNLGCYGDGGAIFTNNDKLAKQMRAIVNHGMKVRYYHDVVGVNSRLDSIQAAILRIKLPLLDTYNNTRLEAAKYYNQKFENCENIITPKISENSTHVFHQYTLRLKGVVRTDLQKYLMEKGIPAMIYYPVPLRKQKAYQNTQNNANFEITDMLCKEVISLPMHTELTKEQQDFITESILDFIYNKA